MSESSSIINNPHRLQALQSYQVLDTIEEKDFDDIASLAASICQVPIALISLVDRDRQWFKSKHGIAVTETPLGQSLCAQAIQSTDDIFIIDDTRSNQRFSHIAITDTETPFIFYAGVPLINNEGFALGTLCVADDHPRELTGQQKQSLKILARQVMDKLELRRKVIQLQEAGQLNRRLYQSIEQNRNLALIEQAPVAIIILRGADYRIDAVNQPMLALLGKTADIINQPLLQALPELEWQQPYQQIKEVYETGTRRQGVNTPILLNKNGREEIGYYNFTCAPLLEDGKVSGVINMAADVTELVKARMDAEAASEKLLLINQEITKANRQQLVARQEAARAKLLLNQALASAQIGTWYMEPDTHEFIASQRFKEIFGYLPDEDLNLPVALGHVTPDYRQIIADALDAALNEGKSYDLEYTMTPRGTQDVRWIRTTGRFFNGDAETKAYLSGTVLDVTDRKKVEERKSDFIGIVSHELKTPLTSMGAYLQLLQMKAEKAGDDYQANALKKANKQVAKMSRMVQSFLSVSRIKDGKIHLDPETFDLSELAAEIVEESKEIYPNHQINLNCSGSFQVYADRDKIGQVITNFVSNAVKYAPESHEIDLHCNLLESQPTISVTDYGPGISPQHQQKVFDRYYRVEDTHSKTILGFGIGLYLCLEIIQRHKGRIWVESELGKGSTFSFSLQAAAQ
ncbi:ATP-binding protein [Mucilaginibacter sp. CSA2-8R]|uniref:ATP-binding protein n=1 Tax=Mucilaginibacter sp. CSA2-8R TaxID=3141542 RepID=UPI00315D50B6